MQILQLLKNLYVLPDLSKEPARTIYPPHPREAEIIAEIHKDRPRPTIPDRPVTFTETAIGEALMTCGMMLAYLGFTAALLAPPWMLLGWLVGAPLKISALMGVPSVLVIFGVQVIARYRRQSASDREYLPHG